MITRGLPLGIDFSGGTLARRPLQPGRHARSGAERGGLACRVRKSCSSSAMPSERRVLIRLPQQEGVEEGAALEQASLRAEQALRDAGLPSFEIDNREIVGPVIGADLQRRGIYAVLTSLAAITIYIGVRFRFSFAVGAIAATLHDVLVTLAFLMFFRYDISLNVVAAILTITGYSVNDTIVIFDRVRENLRSRRRDPLSQVVNHERQPDAGTHDHHGRHDVPVGAGALPVWRRGARGLCVHDARGVISGTYSTVFIASAIAIILSQQKGGKAAGDGGALWRSDTERPGRKPRRARAS